MRNERETIELAKDEPGERIRDFLVSHPLVENVFYRPDTTKMHRPESSYSGTNRTISFDLVENTMEAGSGLVRNTRLFGPENYPFPEKSWICHPPSMVLPTTPAYVRRRSRIRDSHILLRVGNENIEELMNDLDTAIRIVHRARLK